MCSSGRWATSRTQRVVFAALLGRFFPSNWLLEYFLRFVFGPTDQMTPSSTIDASESKSQAFPKTLPSRMAAAATVVAAAATVAAVEAPAAATGGSEWWGPSWPVILVTFFL